MKILLLGPKRGIDEKRTGGTIVLFDIFINELINQNIDFIIIDTNKSNYKNKITAYFSIIIQIACKTRKCIHLSLHGTAMDYLLIGPFVILFTKIFGKKISLRKFAGNFDEIYKQSNFIKKNIIRFVLKNSDINFFETKYLVKFFSKFNQDTFWFPNVRRKNDYFTSNSYSKKFIYLGHIQEEKGVEDLFQAAKFLSNDYSIDFYGNITEKKYKVDEFWKSEVVTYKGVLKPDEVPEIISKYDVLILPSYREGYPGVIIEAFSVGVPVIATFLQGISEIVEDKESGVLISIKDPLMLADSIRSFSNFNYQKYSESAKKAFLNFDAELQTKRIIKLIQGEFK
jgi:glycosyltransferase involved in cell wall biosynthesis